MIYSFIKNLINRFSHIFSRKLRTTIISGDSIPASIPKNTIILARDGNENWCVGLLCPCGCGRVLELLTIAEASPRWDVFIDRKGYMSLYPSVWVNNGCRSHFWIHGGKVKWVAPIPSKRD